MSGFLHLYRRESGIYFVRLYVPQRLKRAVGKGEVHRSTGCRDFRLAKIVAAELAAHWHRSIASLHHMDVEKLKAGSLKLIGDGYIALTEAATECGATPSDLANRLCQRHFAIFVKVKNLLGWMCEDIYRDLDHGYNSVTGELEEVVIDEKSLGGLSTQRQYTGYLKVRFPQELNAILDGTTPTQGICQFLFWPSTDRAFVCDLPGHSVSLCDLYVRQVDALNLTTQLLETFKKITTANKDDNNKVEPVKRSAIFSDLSERYFFHNSELWKKTDHLRRKKQNVEIFLELAGDLHISEIDRKTMRDFAVAIKDIPANRRLVVAKFKLHIHKDSYRSLIAVKKEYGLVGLTAGEQRKILDTISQILSWAKTEGEIETNHALELGSEAVRKSGKRKKKAHEQRSILAPEELKKIFSASWFINGVGELTAAGNYYHFRPYYYWLPLLALYCGGRLNELSQLYLKDIIIVDNINCLHFNLIGEDKIDIDESDLIDAHDKSLKNISSERIIPIPQYLLDLGFIDYANKLKELGFSRLFPELLFDDEKGYGKYAGKWFNDSFMGKQLAIPRNGKKTFHSLRHNFATALGSVKAETNQKADLMGHMRKGSMSDLRYDKGVFAKLKQLVDLIEHPHPKPAPFNIDQGIKALQDALSLKNTRVGRKSAKVSP